MNTAPPDPTASFTPGTKLSGVYVLRQKVAQAESEAPIWQAYDEVLGKEVTLHFIPANVRSDSRAMNELRQEVKRNRQLIHPNILRVYDLIEEPDWTAISMDSFDGESLASLREKREGRFFEPSDIKPWLQQILSALEDVHKIQIVHRNLSPANLFVDRGGKVFIANFGISRVIEDALGRSVKPGEGTERHLVYMSPQQLDGEPPNKTDDIYSLGASIYELLAGEAPFTNGDLVPQIRKAVPEPIMERRGKLGKRGGSLLPVWEKAIAAALAKTAEERPQTALDFAGRLGVSAKSEGALASGKSAKQEALAEKPTSSDMPKGARKFEVITGGVSNAASPKDSKSDARPAGATSKVVETSENMAPAKSYAEIAAAVQEDELKALFDEDAPPAGTPKAVRENRRNPASVREKKSNGKLVAALVLAVAVVSGLIYHFSNNGEPKETSRDVVDSTSSSDSAPSSDSQTSAPAKATGAEDKKPADSASPDATTPAPQVANNAPDGHTPDASPSASQAAQPAAPVAATPAATASAPPIAQAPEAVATARPLPVAPSDSAAMQFAAHKERDKDKDKDKAPGATPATGALGTNGSGAAPSGASAAAPASASSPTDGASVERIQEALAATEKQAEEAKKAQQQAESALAAAQKQLDEKSKSAGPGLTAIKELQAQRQQKEDQVKAADLAAQQARQVAEEKARLAADAKKALTDWESQNGQKLSSQSKLESELQALQATVAEKQRAAETAAKSASDADAARQQQLAALKKAQDREQRQQQIAAKLQNLETLQKQLNEQFQELQKMKQELDGGAAAPNSHSAPAPSSPVKPSGDKTPAKPPTNPLAGGTETQPATATPAKIVSPPPAPPPPRPIKDGSLSDDSIPSLPTPGETAQEPPNPTSGAASAVIAPPHPSSNPASTADAGAGSSHPAAASNETHPDATPAALPSATKSPAEPASGAAPTGKSEFENSLGMKFAPVGDVLFCIWPTRVQDFEVFAKEASLKSTGWRNPGFKQGPDHPVVMVTWNDAMGFCKWLTERDRKKGLISNADYYRLPTDLEWSKAVGLPEESGKTPEARDMGVPDVFPWGTQWPPPPGAGNYTGEETGSDVAIKGYDDGFAWTSPVGSFKPNKFGLYDMGGNVWQWCMDNWNPESKAKVLRGASWYNGSLRLSLLSSCRMNEDPNSSADNYGFRVVRAPEALKAKGK